MLKYNDPFMIGYYGVILQYGLHHDLIIKID